MLKFQQNLPEADDGSWLSAPGPYQNFIKALCAADPTLRTRDKKLVKKGIPWTASRPRVVVFEVTKTGQFGAKLEFDTAGRLQEYLDQRRSDTEEGRRTAYLLEGLSPEFIGIMGGHFMLHPSIFAEHARTSRSANNQREAEHPMPSTMAGRDHVCLRYSELYAIPSTMQAKFGVYCQETGRHIFMIRTYGKFSKAGMLSRKCSVWTAAHDNGGGWDALVISDPPLRRASLMDRSGYVSIAGTPWGGGYVDFLPQKDQMRCLTGPPRTSMMDDLCYYLENHSHHLDLNDGNCVAFYAKKIIANHYGRQFEYLKKINMKVRHKVARHHDLSEFTIGEIVAQWTDVQDFERRITLYSRDLTGNMTQLRIPQKAWSFTDDWKDTASDFQVLYAQSLELQHCSETLNASVTGLASIAASRQSFKEQQMSVIAAERSVREARRSRALVLVGLVFIPLAYVASLFSMAEPYGPGNPRFWLYFAISFPLVGLVVSAYYVLDFGYSQDGTQWSIDNCRGQIKELVWTRGRMPHTIDKVV